MKKEDGRDGGKECRSKEWSKGGMAGMKGGLAEGLEGEV